VYVYYFIIIVF